jgi:phenylalanyl-tRNA synthetase beta chain
MLYEFGTCYFYDKKEKRNEPLDSYSEYQHLALFITGKKYETNWLTKDESFSFFDLKAYVENILLKLGFQVDDLQTTEPGGRNDIFNEGVVFMHQKDTIAEMGLVTERLLKMFDLKSDVFYANLYWDRIIEKLRDFKIQFTELPKYPEVRRDLSMILDKNITFEQIRKLAYQTEKVLLKQVHLFDVYEGKGIEKDKKSYAVTFVLQDRNKTLVDAEIDAVMDRLMRNYENKLHAKIRK